jgi:hypothetical protein
MGLGGERRRRKTGNWGGGVERSGEEWRERIPFVVVELITDHSLMRFSCNN